MRHIYGIGLIGLLQLMPLAAPGSVDAQTTNNPTTVTFTASLDHNARRADGTPVVQSYQLDLFLAGASAPFQSVNLGKPTPDATNTIAINASTLFAGWPIPGTIYVADVAAVGPGGTSASALSNTFAFSTATASTDGTQVPPASQIVDNSGAIWTIGANGVILRNGVQAGGGRGSRILWQNATIYALGTDNTWWQWVGSGWVNVGAIQQGTTTSPDGTQVPPATQIVDNSSAIWTLSGNGAILRNGVQAGGGWGSKILWQNTTIYVLGTDNQWWQWVGSGWVSTGPNQP